MFYCPVYGKLKQYGSRYKLIVSNVERRTAQRTERAQKKKVRPLIDERVKARNNMCRAKSRVYELAMCNEWDYFCTFTLDPEKYDRYNLARWQKDFSQWLRDQRKNGNPELRYLLLPEHHQDGAWHMHGFIGGLSKKELTPFVRGKHPRRLVDGGYLNWEKCSKKFGYCSLGKLRNKAAAATYALKYVQKGFYSRVADLGARLFYASKGLKGARVVCEGEFALGVHRAPDFENEWCRLYWFNELDHNFACVDLIPMCAKVAVSIDLIAWKKPHKSKEVCGQLTFWSKGNWGVQKCVVTT